MTITPIQFKSGSSFLLTILLPETVEKGVFSNWTPTAQIRKQRSSLPSGFIAELGCFWKDPVLADKLEIFHADTDGWPEGSAELDILFTSAEGIKVHSPTIPVIISTGITR